MWGGETQTAVEVVMNEAETADPAKSHDIPAAKLEPTIVMTAPPVSGAKEGSKYLTVVDAATWRIECEKIKSWPLLETATVTLESITGGVEQTTDVLERCVDGLRSRPNLHSALPLFTKPEPNIVTFVASESGTEDGEMEVMETTS
jgi:hypothetical protein